MSISQRAFSRSKGVALLIFEWKPAWRCEMYLTAKDKERLSQILLTRRMCARTVVTET